MGFNSGFKGLKQRMFTHLTDNKAKKAT